MADKQLQDQDVRRRIGPWQEEGLPPLEGFEADKNFVVRAAAGSGKTTALVGRMLSLVRSGVPVGEIVAITFTNKAAGEMQGRFYTELQDAARAASGAEKERLEKALGDLSQCFIGTIHSFCSRLLRGRSEQIGIPRDFTGGLEDRERKELRRRFWQQYLQQSWSERREAMEALIGAGVELSELELFFEKLVRVPELTPYVDGPEEPPSLEEAVVAARDLLGQWEGYRPDRIPDVSEPCHTLVAFNEAERLLNHRGLETPADQAAFLNCFDGLYEEDGRSTYDTDYKGRVKPSHWTDSDEVEILRDEVLAPFVMEVVEPVLRDWKAQVHRQIASFVHEAVDAFRQERWAQGQLTFHDLLLAARDLLCGSPEVRRRLQKRYRYVLVDEFQDTDPVQAELLFYLTGQRRAETDWKRCEPAPGRLFIVGDDKQSIYGFRSADLDVFDAVCDRIEEQEGGAAEALTSNFRSAEEICEWCDAAFGALFAGDREAFEQADYVPFAPTRQAPEDWAAVRQLKVPYVKGQSSSTKIAERNARQIARYIRGVCDRHGKNNPLLYDADEEEVLVEGTPGDFMILTRDTTRLSIFAEALAEVGIPYAIAGGKDAGASEELRGLVDLLACVYRPDDAVARVAYLRGPLVGLSDDDLYRYRQAGGWFNGRFELVEEVREKLGEELAGRIKRAYQHLEVAEGLVDLLARVYRPDDAVARVAYLRGPLVGLSDDDLYRYRQAGGWFNGRFELVEEVREKLGEELAGRIKRAYQHLEVAEELLARCRPAAAIDQIAERTGLFARALQDARQGSLKAGRLVRILEEVRHLDAGGASWAEVLEELERILAGDAELDGMTLETGQKDSVRLLNVHKAKGLEANVVFLADPYSSSYPRSPKRYVQREEGKIVQPVLVKKGYHTELKYGPVAWHDRFEEEAERKQLSEEHRLQYVAATRAKYLLVVSRYEGKADKGYWADLYEHLDRHGAPELVVPEGSEGEEAEASNRSTPDLEAQRQKREAKLLVAKAPAYRRATVTEDKEEPDVYRSDKGYGASFGSAVHRLFEALIQRRRQKGHLDESFVRSVIRSGMEKGTEADVRGARRMLERWTESDLWEEVLAARRVYTEVPVASFERGEEAVLKRGVIDLAFEAAGGWTIVDFKTDRVGEEGDLSPLVDRYASQVETYARRWREQAEAPVQQAGLWFADLGQWMPLVKATMEDA